MKKGTKKLKEVKGQKKPAKKVFQQKNVKVAKKGAKKKDLKLNFAEIVADSIGDISAYFGNRIDNLYHNDMAFDARIKSVELRLRFLSWCYSLTTLIMAFSLFSLLYHFSK